jgi:hypothetical protein
MFCPNCGNEVTSEARFCSRCGQAMAAPAGQRVQRPRDWDTHVNVLGWLLVACGILTGGAGLMVVFAGSIIARMPMFPPGLPFGIRMLVGPLSALAGVSILAVAGGLAAAGVGLFRYRDWARILALVMSAFAVFHFPLGTAIAIYAFWVLLSEEGRAHYRRRSVEAAV